MQITPVEIGHKSFTKKMFGYDEQQVHEFLQQVAAHLETLTHERNNLREQVREKDIQISEYKQRDHALQSTIATASQMADKIRIDADREAKLIVADAQQRADNLVRDAKDALKKLYQEMSDMKKLRLQFEANLRALAQAHIQLIEQGERYMPTEIENKGQVAGQTSTAHPSSMLRSTAVSPLSN